MGNGFVLYFSETKEPRVERTKYHLLGDIMLITIAAVLSYCILPINKSVTFM